MHQFTSIVILIGLKLNNLYYSKSGLGNQSIKVASILYHSDLDVGSSFQQGVTDYNYNMFTNLQVAL